MKGHESEGIQEIANMTITTRENSRPTAHELSELVENWVGYIRRHVRPPCDVDDVMQDIRESVLRAAHTYDSDRGAPNAFIGGIVKNLIAKAWTQVYADRDRLSHDELPVTLAATDASSMEPLAFLLEHREQFEWVQLAANSATDIEWRILVTLVSNDGTAEDAARTLGIAPTTVRSAIVRVRALVFAARTAIAARDDGRPVTLESCVSADSVYATVLPYQTADTTAAAEELHLSGPAFRSRMAMIRRISKLVRMIGAPPASAMAA